ncbi:MAG TPA: hypothetical protein VMT16_06830 [Thermoanaerobaculia bacterium]|nr:hypothetical protein [Thermoanaerobaculia bacterium]
MKHVLLVVLAGACLGACGRTPQPVRPAGSAVWLGSESTPPSVGELARLEAVGAGELFVEVGRLQWSGGVPKLVPTPVRAVGRRTPGVLVIHGPWAPLPGEGVDLSVLLPRVEAMRRRAEGARVFATGIHFDLEVAPAAVAGYGDALRELRDALDDQLTLSVSVSLELMTAEDLPRLARATDFLVPFCYGERPERLQREAADAWDLRAVHQALRRFEELGEPYLLGVVTLGGLLREASDGALVEITTEGRLEELVWDRGLRLLPGFALAPVDRQTYTFVVEEPVRLAGGAVPRGQRLRVVGLSARHVEALREQLESWQLEHLLGAVYYRLPGAGEALALAAPALVAALTAQPALPSPRVEVETAGESGGPPRMRVRLLNDSPVGSELAFVDHNWIELHADGGSFGEVAVGDFYRYELYRRQPGGELIRTLRQPDVLRLYAPYLAPAARLASGEIELLSGRVRAPELTARSNFLAPLGQEVERGPTAVRAAAPLQPAADG